MSLLFMSISFWLAEPTPLLTPPYRWLLSPPRIAPPRIAPPRIAPARRADDPCHAIKDPTVVFHQGKWHIFATIRSKKRTHQIEYLAFLDWARANQAPRHVLNLHSGYYCAPQVFYFTPHQKWYIVYQSSDAQRKPQLQPAFASSSDLGNPRSWSEPNWLFADDSHGVRTWIDFWIICDHTHARLFFTSLDGKMWRCDAPLETFPRGWGKPQLALQADIFEASHTYKILGQEKYITLIEAQAGSRRYYKAYTADKLDGGWQPLADTWENPFAGLNNLPEKEKAWTQNVSHGELLRAGFDERLEVNPRQVRMVFQGVADREKQGKGYGEIPWQLGLLELVTDTPKPR